MNKIITTVKKRLKAGGTLRGTLDEIGISYTKWRAICDEEGVTIKIPTGPKPKVYTLEKAKEVKRRVRAGEFVKDACADLGMNYENFCRFCRKAGIKVMTAKALKANYARRDYSRAGRQPGGRVSQQTKDIRKMIRRGKTNKQIAAATGVSWQYVQSLRKKKTS